MLKYLRLNFHLSNNNRLQNVVETESFNLFTLIGEDFEEILKSLSYSTEKQTSKFKTNLKIVDRFRLFLWVFIKLGIS